MGMLGTSVAVAGTHSSRTRASGSLKSVLDGMHVAQTRPQFILSSEGVENGGKVSFPRTHRLESVQSAWNLYKVDSRIKIPDGGWIRSRDLPLESPTPYPLCH